MDHQEPERPSWRRRQLTRYFNMVSDYFEKLLLEKSFSNHSNVFQTSATFLRVVGSELIQKYLGDGPKLVRELFRVAEEHAPSIVFIDEIDAVGTKRYDSNSGGEREIQRTMLELLNQVIFHFQIYVFDNTRFLDPQKRKYFFLKQFSLKYVF